MRTLYIYADFDMQQLDSAERAAAVVASQHREGLGEGARECGHGGRAEQQLRVRQAGPQRPLPRHPHPGCRVDVLICVPMLAYTNHIAPLLTKEDDAKKLIKKT